MSAGAFTRSLFHGGLGQPLGCHQFHMPRSHSADGTVHFRLRVEPEGWAWPVWFMQQALGNVLDSSVSGVKIRQRRPSPPLQLGLAHPLLEAQIVRLIFRDTDAALALTQEVADEVLKGGDGAATDDTDRCCD